VLTVQTMTTLHKQNFDLKLELFHRREKQTALEDRVESLEAEKLEREVLNDKLLTKLEMQDKALEEAVGMIVKLEARMDDLLRERGMVRQVDAEGFGRSSLDQDSTMRVSMEQDDDRVLARMPSFLSDRSEHTANLRNVFLARASLLSLPRMTEDAADVDSRLANNFPNPSLSVLSESSFLSIYGQKHDARAESTSPPRDPTTADSLSDKKSGSSQRSTSRGSPLKNSTATRPRRSDSLTRNNASGTFSSISELMDMQCSPLQRLEKMEKSLAAMNEASRPGSQETQADAEQLARHLKSQIQPRTKQEKREALRKVRTDTPFSRDLLNQHNLPPTPDTISTSTLRRLKNSNDTLPREKDANNEKSYLALSDAATSRSSSVEKSTLDAGGNHFSQPPSTTAFNSRRDQVKGTSYFDNRIPIPPRPRSADETTVSHHGRNANGWDSDTSEELNGDDSASLHDYWLRESLRPPKGLVPAVRKASTSYGRPGRTSPDLFSFPTSPSGWATDAMFGSLGGNGYLGGGAPPLSQTLDALGDSLPAPQVGMFGSGLASPGPNGAMIPPPPPNRRSSLHAHTGASSTSQGTGAPVASSPASKLRKSPTRRPALDTRSRSNSMEGRPPSAGQAVVIQQQEQEQVAVQKRHYPPASSATNAPRARGLKIFRRSGSHEPAPRSAPPTETVFGPASVSKNIPLVGIPSWGKRVDLDDDRESATPPPILRNPRLPQSRGKMEGEATMTQEGTVSTPGSRAGTANGTPRSQPKELPLTPVEDPPPSSGGRRKWLGLGRVSSLRNRAG
jgi:hypothetical protein